MLDCVPTGDQFSVVGLATISEDCWQASWFERCSPLGHLDVSVLAAIVYAVSSSEEAVHGRETEVRD